MPLATVGQDGKLDCNLKKIMPLFSSFPSCLAKAIIITDYVLFFFQEFISSSWSSEVIFEETGLLDDDQFV